MNRLVIPLSAISETGLDIDTEIDVPAELSRTKGSAAGSDYELGSIRVHGSVRAVEDEYLFRGTLSGAFTALCDRCLVPSRQPYTLEVTWFFEEGLVTDEIDPGEIYEVTESDDGEPARCFSGTEIDLTEHVREEVMLSAPVKFICKDDCKGLCPSCGANLNEGACSCIDKESQGHPELAKLAEMFPDLRPSEDS